MIQDFYSLFKVILRMALHVILRISKCINSPPIRWASSMRITAFRRQQIIRWAGVFLVCFYILIGVVNAGGIYDRVLSKVDQSSISKTITGVSEMQCLHKCRRSAECKKTLYERGTSKELSHCYFLKDSTFLDINSGKRGVLLREMQGKKVFAFFVNSQIY